MARKQIPSHGFLTPNPPPLGVRTRRTSPRVNGTSLAAAGSRCGASPSGLSRNAPGRPLSPPAIPCAGRAGRASVTGARGPGETLKNAQKSALPATLYLHHESCSEAPTSNNIEIIEVKSAILAICSISRRWVQIASLVHKHLHRIRLH